MKKINVQNHGCLNCKNSKFVKAFPENHSPRNGYVCKNNPKQILDPLEGPEYKCEYCRDKNVDNKCEEFKPKLSYRIKSFFRGDFCITFGHKIRSSGGGLDRLSHWYCTRDGCDYREEIE